MKKLTLKRQFNIILVLFLVVNTCFYPLANGNKNSTNEEETTTTESVYGETESTENDESIKETESFDETTIAESTDTSNSENERESDETNGAETKTSSEDGESSESVESDKEITETESIVETEKNGEEIKENINETTETTKETVESKSDDEDGEEDIPEIVDEVSTASEVKGIDELNISSMSEVDGEIGEEVKEELMYTTLDLLDSNIWTISDSVMTLNQDITLNKPILIDRDLNINFSNYVIDTSIDEYVFIVVDSTVTFNDGTIKGRNGDRDKPDGSDTISLINSNLTINNCNIYGGNGYTIKDLDEEVGNGGIAIVARCENNDKKIIFNSGEVVGGNGGTGNVREVQGIGGLAISGNGISSKKRINKNVMDIENGSNGDMGCGNGGTAIVMLGDNLSIDNIEINSSGIRGGNAGLEIKNTKRKLLKKNKLGADLPEKYNSVDNGWTSSLKNQGNTNMCSTFSFCSVAETQLIKKYPEKLQEMGYDNPTNIDLSEYAEHFYIFTPPIVYSDYYNSTSYIRESSDVSRFTDIDPDTGVGTETEKDKVTDQALYLIDHATLNSKRFGLTTEAKAPFSFVSSKKDLYTINGKDESPIALNNRVAILKSAEMLQQKNASVHDEYIKDLKNRIINSGSILLGLDPGFQVTQTVYNGQTIRVLSKSSSSGHVGHCVALVGYDDTFQNGAFIAKDSNSSQYYTYIPYDMENGNWEAMDCEFELKPVGEVVFSNDQGMTYNINTWMRYSLKNGYGARYKIEEVIGVEGIEVEKLKAVTVMLPQAISNLTVRVVEVQENDTRLGKANIKEVIAEKDVNTKEGLNYIDFTDVEKRNLTVGRHYLVTVSKNSTFDIYIDCNDGEGKTIISPNNYVYDSDGWKRVNASATDAMNPRIKLLTGIAPKVTFNGNGGKFENEEISYEDYFTNGEAVKGLKIPTRNGYEFLGYSEDQNATTATLTEGSIYEYGFNEKVFYAVWKLANYKATFDANGGQFEDNTTSYEKEYTVESNITNLRIPTREGYEFLGYSTDEYATEPTIVEGTQWTYNGDRQFYAVWKEKPVESSSTNQSEEESTNQSSEEESSSTEPSTSETESTSQTETSATPAPTTTQSSGSSGRNNGGSGGSSSGGSRGGGISIAKTENALLPTTANQAVVEEKPIGANVLQPIDDANSVKMTQNSVDVTTTKIAWSYNEAIKKWNMLFENETSKNIEFAVNGFYKVNDNTNVDSSHLNEYVFDAYGNMITGFVSDKSGKWYFFDDVENDNIGRKVKGWRKYGENWYYFSNEGVMYQDATTPDGYYINPNGVWNNQTASTNTTTTTAMSPAGNAVANPTTNTTAVSPANPANTVSATTNTKVGATTAVSVGPSADTNKNATTTNGSFGPGVMIDTAKNNTSKVIGLSNTTK